MIGSANRKKAPAIIAYLDRLEANGRFAEVLATLFDDPSKIQGDLEPLWRFVV